jgi:predicted 3-demethylubiquinone-9 3-methyltransferase (glyoxalase superfamily)
MVDSSFTRSISTFVACDTEDEPTTCSYCRRAGEVVTVLRDYGSSRTFGWVDDGLGVS